MCRIIAEPAAGMHHTVTGRADEDHSAIGAEPMARDKTFGLIGSKID